MWVSGEPTMSLGDALSESYPAVPEAVPLARRALTAVAVAAGAAGERLDEIRLAISEALTNAVVHAYRDGEAGRFHVTAAVASNELWVLVGDDGRGLHAWNESRGLGIGLSPDLRAERRLLDRQPSVRRHGGADALRPQARGRGVKRAQSRGSRSWATCPA